MRKYGKILIRTFAVLLAFALVISGVELSGLLGAKRDSFTGNAVAADGGDSASTTTYELDLYNFIHVTAAGGNGYGRLRRTNITTASDLNDLVNSSNSPYTLMDSDIVSVTPYDFSNEILVLDAKKDHTNLDPYNGTYVWLDDILSGRASYDSDQFTGCYMVGENKPIQAFNKKLGGSGYGFVYQLNSGEEYFSATDIKCIHRDYPVTILKGEPTNQKLYSFLSITGTGVTGHNKSDYYRLSKLDDTIYMSPLSELTTDFSIDESYEYYDQIVSGHYDFSNLELSFGGKTYKYKDADYKPTESDFEPYYQVVFRSIIVSEKVHHGNENWFTDSAGWLDGDGTEWSDVTSNNTKLFHRDYIATLHAPGDNVKIRFYDEDGTSLLQSENQKEGQQTVYNNELPSKPSDDNFNYVLYWKDTNGNEFRYDELPMVTGAEDYTAVFHACAKLVTVTISGNTDTKTYSGSEQSVSGYDVSISSDLYTEDDFTFSGNDVVNGTDAGTYYSELTADQFTNTNPDFGEVQFVIENQIGLTINPAALTITAKDVSLSYSGTERGYGTGTVYTKNFDSYVTVEGLAGSDALTSITLSGAKKNAGEYAGEIVPSSALVGDSTGNYTITYNAGDLTITRKPVVLTSSSGTKEYDGMPLTKPEVTIGGEGFVYGEVAEIKATGSVLTVGEVTNTITYTEGPSFNADNYNITINEGTLTVTKNTKPLAVASSTKSWEYDGQTHKYEVYTVTFGDEEYTAQSNGTTAVVTLSTGDKLTITPICNGVKYYNSGSGTPNSFSWAVEHEDCYTKGTDFVGTLSISKNSAEIKVVPGSDSKMYDGTPLTKNEHDDFDVTGVPDGFTWTAAADGTVTNVVPDSGEKATNTVTDFVILDADGNDVTDQFANIDTTETGTLTITKRSVTLTSAEDEKEYDGNVLTNSAVTVGGDGFAVGEGAAYHVTGSQTDAGTSENTFTYVLEMNTLADNYEITTVLGTLKVTPLEAVLEWSDIRFPYDGENHVPFATVTNLVDGDDCDVTVSGEKKEVGEDYVATATELSNPNYKLPAENTTLFSIYGCTVIFKNFDGTELSKISVPFGTKPVYDGETPAKDSTDMYSYEFEGWTPEIVAVDKDETVYTATFKEVLRTYSVEPSDLPEGVKLSVSGKQTVDAGEDFTFTITVSDGYDKNDSFAVKANGTTITPDENGNYKISGILEDVKITVSGVVKVSYSVTEGDKTKHVIGEKTVAKYVFKRNVNDAETFGKNTEVLLDGKALEAGQFTKSSGSLIVELKPDYMDSLSVGEHTLTVHFSDYDGDVNATLIVEKAADPAPGTGDTGNLTLWIVIGVVSLIVFIALFLLICKRRKEDEEED